MKTRLLNDVIEKYISGIKTDPQHRYHSWNHCYQAFSVDSYDTTLALQLGFYLASWGMYRGSGGLLQKNHLVHQGAAELVLEKEFKHLKCSLSNEVNEAAIPLILELKNKLSKHYSGIKFTRGLDVKPKFISDTDTLISKIILGTLACVPAYDRYFIGGLKQQGLTTTKFNKESLLALFNFSQINNDEIIKAQKNIETQTGHHYPKMKIVDMYFWQVGYDAEQMAKNKTID